jgi:hypothetical protein
MLCHRGITVGWERRLPQSVFNRTAATGTCGSLPLRHTSRKTALLMWQIFKEFLLFLREEKKWWLVPFVVILLLLGVLLAFAPTSPLAPFIYSFF